MFLKLYVPGALCSRSSIFLEPEVPKTLCSRSPIFPETNVYAVCVTISLAVRPTLLQQIDYRMFNVRTNLGLCRTHIGGSGTYKLAQELTQRDRKTSPRSARGSNPGSLDLNCEAPALSSVPCGYSPHQWQLEVWRRRQ